jgi:hypothetical protein
MEEYNSLKKFLNTQKIYQVLKYINSMPRQYLERLWPIYT